MSRNGEVCNIEARSVARLTRDQQGRVSWGRGGLSKMLSAPDCPQRGPRSLCEAVTGSLAGGRCSPTLPPPEQDCATSITLGNGGKLLSLVFHFYRMRI